MGMQYVIAGVEDGTSNLTVFIDGALHPPIHSTHPNWEQIVEKVMAGDESVVDLFDVSVTVAKRFERLSDRISVANGRVYLDGDEMNNSLTEQILRFLQQGVDDWIPLVNFYEHVMGNPEEHSREQLYRWLNTHDFTIDPGGYIVGYKGVQKRNDEWYSIHSGKAIVNGEVHSGHIPNPIGAIVEMPRSEVEFNPSEGCSTGLHVGTWDYASDFSRGAVYASDFSRGAVLEVHVNPRDVVSVPTDSGDQKMRVCRYEVIGVVEQAYAEPLLEWNENEYDPDGFCSWGEYCPDCGEEEDVCECDEEWQ
jgi:hypothetical protein